MKYSDLVEYYSEKNVRTDQISETIRIGLEEIKVASVLHVGVV